MPHLNEAVLASLQTCCVLFHPGAFAIPFAFENCMASLTPLSGLQGHFSGSFPEVRQLCCSFLPSQFSSVQSLSHVQLFATPWTTAHQSSLSITDSWSLLKVMSIESVMPSNHLILCCVPFSSCLQSFPASGSFQMSQLCASGGQNIGVSASTSVLPMNTQD